MKATSEIGMEIQPARYYGWIYLQDWKKSIDIRFVGFYCLTAVESNFWRSTGEFA